MTLSRTSKFSRLPAYSLALLIITSSVNARPAGEGGSRGDVGDLAQIATLWSEYLDEHGMPSVSVLAVSRDSASGELWLGTMGAGLVRFSGGRFLAFDQMNSGLPGNIVFDVEVFDGAVWAATNAGVSAFDVLGDRWRLYNARTASFPHFIFTQLAADGEHLCAWDAVGNPHVYNAAEDAFVASQSAECKSVVPSVDVMWRTGAVSDQSSGGATRNPAIAVYGPRNRTLSIPGALSSTSGEAGRPELAAVERAVEATNKNGGYRSERLFELVTIQPGYANYAWGLPEDDLVQFAAKPDILGVVGFIARGEHTTEAVISRMDLPWLNVGPPAMTLAESQSVDDLVFQCRGGEVRQHRAVFDYAVHRAGGKRVAFLSGPGLEASRHIAWWEDYAVRRKAVVVRKSQLPIAPAEAHAFFGPFAAQNVDIVLVWADCRTSLSTIRALRGASSRALIVTGPEVTGSCAGAGSDLGDVIAFLPDDEMGTAATGTEVGGDPVNILLPASPSSNESVARSFAATQHLLSAIDAAGTSREAVRRKLSQLRRSALGEEHFERSHPATPVKVAEFIENAWRTSTLQGG